MMINWQHQLLLLSSRLRVSTTQEIRAMKIHRRHVIKLVGASVASSQLPKIALSQNWPTRPIRAILPYAAGTSSDSITRLVLDQLARQLGQPIVVENRPGAGGTIGAAVVAKATSDGYTILLDNIGHTIAPTLYHNLPYDPVNDFVPVAQLATAP